MKRAVGVSRELRRIRKQTLWRGRPPPKREKKLHTEEPDMWEYQPLHELLPPTVVRQRERERKKGGKNNG
jgi:hypothetical protein